MSATPLPSGSDRRRAPRMPAGNSVEARTVPDAQLVTVRDVSTGGFLLESDQPFRGDAIHQFRLAARDGNWETIMVARSVHSRPRSPASPTTYLTGFAFVAPRGEDAERRILELIDKITSVVSY